MRTSLVTGASSGIGEAVARRLARRGDRVVVNGTSRDKVAALVAELGGPERAAPLVLDVADRAAVLREVRALGPLHTVVLSAGVCRQARIDEEDDDATWFRVLDVNLHGVYSVIKAAAPEMPPGGRIVVVSSGLGKLGRPGYAAYCASKHAVLGVVKCVSKELAPRGITVNAVCPGWVDTPMARGDVVKLARERGVSRDEVLAEIHAAIPTGRMVSSDECAALIEFLASEAAASITGEAYNISGGEFFA
jgi:NAD(P)-dependent dehydrogenase (short-subunit alcohol dehydrogenase family)